MLVMGLGQCLGMLAKLLTPAKTYQIRIRDSSKSGEFLTVSLLSAKSPIASQGMCREVVLEALACHED